MKFCSQCGQGIRLEIPQDDSKLRYVCTACHFIHYENPKIVVGTIPIFNDQVLLCLRAIEPKSNYWTLPAGFLENGEGIADGAIRETQEEAMITPNIGPLLSVIDVVHANQVHIFFRATLDNLQFSPGIESLDVKMFTLSDIPWEQIAFETVKMTLKAQIEKENNDFNPIYKTID
jgi:ADP-ribose pyrophosphatase YjhB (NUDIX family)